MKKNPLNKIERISLRTVALLALVAEMVDDATGLTSLRGRKGIYDFSRKLNMGEYLSKNGHMDKPTKMMGPNLLSHLVKTVIGI